MDDYNRIGSGGVYSFQWRFQTDVIYLPCYTAISKSCEWVKITCFDCGTVFTIHQQRGRLRASVYLGQRGAGQSQAAKGISD